MHVLKKYKKMLISSYRLQIWLANMS